MKREEIFPLESSQKYQFSDILGIKTLRGKVSSFVMYPIEYTKIVLIIGKTIIKTKKICSYISVLELEFWSIYFGFWTYCSISFKLQNAFCRIRRLAALSVLLHKELYFFWRFVLLGFSCIGSFVASGVQLNCAIFFCILLFLVFSWLAVFLFGVLFICWLENPALPRIKADSLNLLNQVRFPWFYQLSYISYCYTSYN